MKEKEHKKLSKYVKTIIILTAIVVVLNILARFRVICDFYVDNIFRIWVNTYGRLTGIFPFSVGGVMIILGIAILIIALILSILLIFLRKKQKYKRFTLTYLKTVSVIVLIVGIVMTLNCSALYRCSKINAGSRQYAEEELLKVYCHVVEKCNELSMKVNRNEFGEAVYEGDLMEAVRTAVRNMASYNKRFRGYTPRVKPFINNYIYYQTDLIGMYYPFSMEANCSKYLNDINSAFTMAHELSHLKGYIYEDEANYMGFLICIKSGDEFLQYAGYTGVLWYLLDDIHSLDNGSELLENAPKPNDYVCENDYETYKITAMKIIEETKPVIPDKVVSNISGTITDTYLNYYKSEANYSEVTKLLLWYYDGKLY